MAANRTLKRQQIFRDMDLGVTNPKAMINIYVLLLYSSMLAYSEKSVKPFQVLDNSIFIEINLLQ